MLELVYTPKFKRDLRRMDKRGKDRRKLKTVLEKLLNEEPLDFKCCDHALTGNYIGFRECHIEPDWLLIYKVNKTELILTASRTGIHSDLFS